MNRALIFAGGTGKRMNAVSKPKQFLELHGKPVLIYTIEMFERHPLIDDIAVVCIEGWIDELKRHLKQNMIKKVSVVVPGGSTGHDSIRMGLDAMKDAGAKDDDIILIHDGVRPLIPDRLITENIEAVKEHRSSVSASPALESVVQKDDQMDIVFVPDRNNMFIAKAPQSFYLRDIFALYERAGAKGFKSIDPADLCNRFGVKTHITPCSRFNLKITEPADYYIFRALFEAMENEQIPGI